MMWQNRIVGYSEEPPDQLLANPRNWRTHPSSQADALRGVLTDVGIVQNVIANKRTGYLIDGHLRVMEALKAGQPSIPVTWVDVSADEEALILAALDRITGLAGVDAAQLDSLLRDISTDSPALQAMFDDLAQEAGIVPGVEAGAGGDEFDTTPDDGPTRTALGDLWLIGGVHRLLVGDCTIAENVARLMDGEMADIGFTDPPYGVNYTGKDAMTIQNDDGTAVSVCGVRLLVGALRLGGPLYVCFPAEHLDSLVEMWKEPARLQCMIVWVKDAMVMGRKDYHYRHEPLWYGWREGAAHIWKAGRDQTTVWEIPSPQVNEDHPTKKPIALVDRVITNSSAPGALILDPFLGSGTTLIAAHRTGRRCYGLEIEPRYADVILRRAEAEGLTCERMQ